VRVGTPRKDSASLLSPRKANYRLSHTPQTLFSTPFQSAAHHAVGKITIVRARTAANKAEKAYAVIEGARSERGCCEFLLLTQARALRFFQFSFSFSCVCGSTRQFSVSFLSSSSLTTAAVCALPCA
jgi:hypothetical protein